MRIPLALLVAALPLAGCVTMTQDQIAREAARAAITPVVVREFPGVPVEPALDCLIDNASANEILALAADSVGGPTASTVEIVTRIAARPATLQCLASDGLSAFLR
ncbi:hypothetical protein DXV76_16175 [Rhodobacteraceae bacterium CCMM004]|nr:hypothetical protein DXV76_16175 [Rhodobacteraceae bacterium CCMM004]